MEKPNNDPQALIPVEPAAAQLAGEFHYFNPKLFVDTPADRDRDEPLAQEAKLLFDKAFEGLVVPSAPPAPRHKVISAYIQVALEKGYVTENDVIIYLSEHRVGKANARRSIKLHLGSHALFAGKAAARAREIVPPLPTPERSKPKKNVVTVGPPPGHSRAEVARVSGPSQFDESTKFAGGVVMATLVTPELLISLNRQCVKMLDPEALSAAIVPLEDTPYGDDLFIRPMKIPHIHRHSLSVLSDDTLTICGGKETVLNEEERLLFNILLTFGKFGVMPLALNETGISAPYSAMGKLRTKINTHGFGIIRKQGTGELRTDTLLPNPALIRFHDKRTSETSTP